MRKVAVVLLVLAVAACTTSSDTGSDGGSDGGSSTAGTGAGTGGAGTGAGTGGAGTGGAGTEGDAATLDDAGEPDATAADGGSPCNLPVVVGPCEAAIPRFAWNPVSGSCDAFTYGGCQGNANNFQTAGECLAACAPTGNDGGSPAAACKVGEHVFPSGARGIDDPHSCNTCMCEDGQLACTEINCPEACPTDYAPGVGCAECGPTDACNVVEHGCLPSCKATTECGTYGYSICLDDVCKNACG